MKINHIIFTCVFIHTILGSCSISSAQDTARYNFVTSVWDNAFQMVSLLDIKLCKIKSIHEFHYIDSNKKRKLTPISYQYFDRSGNIKLERYFDEMPYSIIYNWLNDSNVIAYIRFEKKIKNFLSSRLDPNTAPLKGYYSMVKSYNKDSNEIKTSILLNSNYSIQRLVIFDSLDKPLFVTLNEPLDIKPENENLSSDSNLNNFNFPKTEFIYNDHKQLITILNGSYESLLTYARIDLYYSKEGNINRKVYDRILTDSIIDDEYFYNGDTSIHRYTFNKNNFLNRNPEIYTWEFTKWKNLFISSKKYSNGIFLNKGDISKYEFWDKK